MRSGTPCAARRPTNSVNSVNLVLLDLLSSRHQFTPLGSDNSHFYKRLFATMAVSMVSGRKSEQELEESHLMLKNAWLCFRISSSFVGNNPSLQIHSFSEDQGTLPRTGGPALGSALIHADHAPPFDASKNFQFLGMNLIYFATGPRKVLLASSPVVVIRSPKRISE
jgi:hypothetical protein